ncbi:MAG: glycosyltransferase [Acidimicrobiales bacterium]
MPSHASIVIPAHNEQDRIPHLLQTLADPSIEGRYDVYVICNGCTDNTSQVAREYDVTVVEMDMSGKHYALNEGDRLAGDVFPRLYCDADIRITPSTIQSLIDTLTTDRVRAAGPEIRYDVERSSRAVQLYFRALESRIMTQWSDQHLTGRGLYGASRAARQRFDAFPGLVADDLFFDSQFTANEKAIVPGTTTVLLGPASFRQLLRSEVRVAQGNHQFRVTARREKFADLGGQPHGRFRLRLRDRVSTLRSWRGDLRRDDVVPILFYLAVIAGARVILIAKTLHRRQVSWR